MTDVSEIARPARRRLRGGLFVIECGLVTTALALLAAYILNKQFELDVFEARFEALIPLGAIGLGVVAASGYAAGSWWAGVRVGKKLLGVILALQIIALFVGQYIAFRRLHLVWRDTHEPVGFWWWYHQMTLGYTLQHLNGREQPMGYGGYFIRLIDTAGFAIGGLLAGALFMRHSYCESCQRFKKHTDLATLAASLPSRPIRTQSESDAFEQEQEAEFERATELFERLCRCAIEGDAPGFKADVASANRERPAQAELLCRMRLSLSWCPGCLNGAIHSIVLRREDGIVRIDPLPGIQPATEFVEGVT